MLATGEVVLELLIGLASDIPYFAIISLPVPRYMDKYLYQWLASLLRIGIYLIFTFCFPIDTSGASFRTMVSWDIYIYIIIAEVLLNAIISFKAAKITIKMFFEKTKKNSWRKRASSLQWILLLFMLPLSEEMFFRVFLFSRWEVLIGFLPALILQSIWFLANHSPFMWVRAFRSISYALAFYLTGGSLFASWLCHVANNFLAMQIDTQQTFH